MEKQRILSAVTKRLDEMRLQYELGKDTDITLACEFLNAGWGTGNKKVAYQASAYLDEQKRTLFLWELTKESGSGFSFGGNSETSFQSGSTLYRKVKSVQYGLDGKAYEYTLDLGSITEAFKEAAKSAGWSFKTVLSREKASYPAGYVPPAVSQEQYNQNSQQPQYTQQAPQPQQPQYNQPHYSAQPQQPQYTQQQQQQQYAQYPQNPQQPQYAQQAPQPQQPQYNQPQYSAQPQQPQYTQQQQQQQYAQSTQNPQQPRYTQQAPQPQQPQYNQPQTQPMQQPQTRPVQPQPQPYQQQQQQQQYTQSTQNPRQPQYNQSQTQPMQQVQGQYPPKGGKQQKSGKKSGIVFWFLFIPLALVMALLLFGSDATLKTCILSVAVLLATLIIHKIIRKGWLANVLLCVASLIVLFCIYAFSDNGGNTVSGTDNGIAPYELKVENPVNYPVESKQEPTVINHKDYKIVLPANVTDAPAQLTVSDVTNAPAAIEYLTPLRPPMDIELGDKHIFDEPITVSIPYDRTKTGELPLENAFTAVYFNEAEGMWEDVPYETDEQAGVVNLKLYHLSTVACYYSYYEGAKIFDDGTSMVIYPIEQSYKELYRKYSDATVNYSGNEVPQLIIDISGMAKDCIFAYRDMGFAMKGKPRIYITPDNTSSKYNSSTGNLCITLSSVTFTDPKTMFMRNVGHELFHKAQAETLGWRVYEATRVRDMSFWLEASADYMGNAGVWKAIGKQQPNRFEIMEKEFFDTSLYTTADPEHQYDAANFANFAMQHNPKVTPMDLVMMANDYNASFDLKFDQCFRTDEYPMLLSYYHAFVNYVLFDPSVTPAERSNKMIRESVRGTNKVVLKDNGSGVMTAEGGFDINIPAPYSAGFHVLSTAEDIVLELGADSPVSVCVMPEIGKRTVSNRVELAAGVPGTVPVKKNEFVLFFATSSSAKTAKVAYKAAAASPEQPEKKQEQENAGGDFTALWNVTNMTVTDIIANGAYWSDVKAVTQGKGKSESIADGNELYKRITRFILIAESAEDPGQLILKFGPSQTIGRDTTLLPINVEIEGNKLKAEGYNMSTAAKEWLEFELTLENGKLSGSCKSTIDADAGSPTTKYGKVTNVFTIEASVDKNSKVILEDYRKWIKDNK